LKRTIPLILLLGLLAFIFLVPIIPGQAIYGPALMCTGPPCFWPEYGSVTLWAFKVGGAYGYTTGEYSSIPYTLCPILIQCAHAGGPSFV
jgi:hypothetical protein